MTNDPLDQIEKEMMQILDSDVLNSYKTIASRQTDQIVAVMKKGNKQAALVAFYIVKQLTEALDQMAKQ